MLEKDFEYYLNNQSDHQKKFGSSFVVIQNQKILGSLPSFKEALHFLTNKTGNFLIQEVNDNIGSQTTMLSI